MVSSSISASRQNDYSWFCIVSNYYWVQLKLKPDVSLPVVTDRYRQNCIEGARACKIVYVGHIKHQEEEVRKSTRFVLYLYYCIFAIICIYFLNYDCTSDCVC